MFFQYAFLLQTLPQSYILAQIYNKDLDRFDLKGIKKYKIDIPNKELKIWDYKNNLIPIDTITGIF